MGQFYSKNFLYELDKYVNLQLSQKISLGNNFYMQNFNNIQCENVHVTACLPSNTKPAQNLKYFKIWSFILTSIYSPDIGLN